MKYLSEQSTHGVLSFSEEFNIAIHTQTQNQHLASSDSTETLHAHSQSK